MAKTEGQFSSFEKQGAFWLPDKPDVQLQGTLRYSPEKGPTLHLFHKFEDESYNQPVIHGLVEGKACTLHKCYYNGSSFHQNHGTQWFSSFRAIHLFMGANIDPRVTRFKSMKVHLTNIEEWFLHVPFKMEECTQHSATAKFTAYECPKVVVPDINAEIHFDYDANLNTGALREFVWKAKLLLEVIPNEPQKYFDYFEDRRRDLEQLFALLIGAPIHTKSVWLEIDAQNTVQFYFTNRRAKESDLHFPEMLVIFPQIKNQWEAILRAWFAASAKLESPLTLFFGARYVPTNPEVDFVRVMQAIESFHRLTSSEGRFMSEDQFKEEIAKPTIAGIPESIDEDVRESVAERIEFANALTLRRRLKRLFGSLPIELLTLVKFDKKDAIDILYNNRNWYTHYSADDKQHALESMELWPYQAGIHALLEYLFLKEAGVPENIFLPKLLECRKMLFNQPK